MGLATTAAGTDNNSGTRDRLDPFVVCCMEGECLNLSVHRVFWHNITLWIHLPRQS